MKHLHTFEPFDWSDVDLTEIKYKKVTTKLIESLHPKIQTIVNKMLTFKPEYNYNNCLLDVKVRLLSKGQCGCPLEEFHYDWVKDYDELPITHETHFIYSNINGTQFQHYKCKDNSIYTYNRELHKGTIQYDDVKRVLIRLSYTDNKKNKSKIT